MNSSEFYALPQSLYDDLNRWTGKELRANQNQVFISGDLGGKQSHAFPLKTIQMHTIQIKTQYFFKISLPYVLKLIKYQVSIVKSKFMEINLSKNSSKLLQMTALIGPPLKPFTNIFGIKNHINAPVNMHISVLFHCKHLIVS